MYVGLEISAFLLYATLLQSQGVIIDGPETVIYFPGQGPIELECNATDGPTISWDVNGESHFLPDIANGLLPNHSINGTNIIVEVPVNNTEYVCVAATNTEVARSVPAFIYIANVPDQVPGFTGMADSMTLQGNTLNLTLSWGEPFNNFDPIISYTVTCSGDVQCPEDHTSPANAMRSYSVTNLNSMTIYNFTIVATNSLGSGEPAVYMTTLISVPEEVTGLNLTCEPSKTEFYNYCTAEWEPITIGNGPLEQPLMYRVYYNGSFDYVASPNTSLTFRAPPVADGYFVSSVVVSVTAVNRFGAGPSSENVSAEIMASSVINVIAMQNDPDTVSNKYDYTFICSIHPESTADICAVTLMNGGIIIKRSSEVIDGNATIVIQELDCRESYTVVAGGLLDGMLVGPLSSHGTITTGICVISVTPTSSIVTMPYTPSSTMTPTPTETVRESGAAAVTICSTILIAITTIITMVMQW